MTTLNVRIIDRLMRQIEARANGRKKSAVVRDILNEAFFANDEQIIDVRTVRGLLTLKPQTERALAESLVWGDGRVRRAIESLGDEVNVGDDGVMRIGK